MAQPVSTPWATAVEKSRSRKRWMGRIGSAARFSTQSRRGTAGRCADQDPALRGADLHQAQQQGHNAGGQQDRAGVIHARLSVSVGLVPPGKGDQPRGQQPRQDVDVEDPAPGELVHEEAAQQRADNGRDAPHPGEESLHFGALLEREHLTDQDKGQGHDAACAQPLQGAREDELRSCCGQARTGPSRPGRAPWQ